MKVGGVIPETRGVSRGERRGTEESAAVVIVRGAGVVFALHFVTMVASVGFVHRTMLTIVHHSNHFNVRKETFLYVGKAFLRFSSERQKPGP